jgi:hypothetical protein
MRKVVYTESMFLPSLERIATIAAGGRASRRDHLRGLGKRRVGDRGKAGHVVRARRQSDDAGHPVEPDTVS